MNTALQRNITRADDLAAFIQERNGAMPVVVRLNEDEEDLIASVGYECNKVVLELVGDHDSKIVDMETTIKDLEEEIIDLKRERDLLTDKLNKIKKAVELT